MTDDNPRYRLSRRKVLAGLGGVGLASAGAGLGTSAYLNDTESFENSTITAGTLDLLVDYYSHWSQGMAGSGQVQGTQNESGTVSGELSDVKPGDSGSLAFCPRIDGNPAYLWVCGELTANDENGQPEPETDVDDTTGPGNGELAQHVTVDVDYCSVDVAASEPEGEFGPDDTTKIADVWEGSLAAFLSAIRNGVPLDGDGNSDAGESGFLAPGDQECYAGGADAENACLCIDWEVPTTVGNEIQSDSVGFDLEFHAEQCRNNDGTHNPCADGDDAECVDCGFEPGPTDNAFSNLLSVGPDATSGFPAVDARVRVDTPAGNAGDLTASNFAVCEGGCAQTLDVTFDSGGIVDIVVVFDDTGSMSGEISTLQSEVTSLTTDIEDAGIDARYALVSFKDLEELDQDFTDASTFQTAVNGLSASGGGDTPEDNLDALAVATGNAAAQDGAGASLSAFRSGAQRVVIDITDVGASPETDADTRFSQSDIETFLDDGNFSFYAVAPASVGSGSVSKRDIAENVDDGSWIDIFDADFDTILNDVVGAITEPAYTLSYTTTDPATDGSSRSVDIQITDPDEGTLYESGSYTAPS
ncbi:MULTISPECIES: SipW-dependent-type signal peptide-containing protein [Halobacterium]|uniref:SipW-dependent-type signal peptide-containing protein n=1 Tax=Halobacterium TaxID=2239 RepID=UPI00073F293A|nr:MULTISPECIES: SipW-dependent-type signal peptide-containing protein [Halobacterium]MCG1003747.1 SipW-dependent-type signal peptide-containing protein [Halobacterium noricense]